MRPFMQECGQSLHDEDEAAEMEDLDENDGRMDEHQWERFMHDSDRRTDRYGELLEKYADSTNGANAPR